MTGKEKKITLEKLAKMIAKGFDTTATKEEMRRGFEAVDQRFEAVDEELKSIRSELGMFRDETVSELKEIKTVLGPLVRTVAGLEIDVNELRSRVARLEQKTGLSK